MHDRKSRITEHLPGKELACPRQGVLPKSGCLAKIARAGAGPHSILMTFDYVAQDAIGMAFAEKLEPDLPGIKIKANMWLETARLRPKHCKW